MQIYTPPNKSRFIRCKKTLINSHAYKSMCMLDCYLLEHALVRYSDWLLSLSLRTRLLSFKPAQPTCDTTRSVPLRGQERRIRQTTQPWPMLWQWLLGYSTGTSTPQQSSSKPSQKNLEMMLCWFQHPLFSRSLPSKTGKQWTYWKVTYNFRNGW